MVEALPHYNFFTEPLHGLHQLVNTHSLKSVGTHLCSLSKVVSVHFKHLDCNLASLVFTSPYFGKLAMIEWGIHAIIAKGDLY